MSAGNFQEFGTASERRRDDQYDARRRKHLMFGGISVVALVLVVAVVAVTVYDNEEDSDTTTPMRSTSKSVEMLCSSTDYQRSCQSSLSKALNDTADPDPKDLLKAAISVVFDEVSNAFNKSQLIKTDDKEVQGAIDDCRELFFDSRDELKRSLFTIVDRGMNQIYERSNELKNWLSAVMSYQRTCIDGFPEGEVKDHLEKSMSEAKELTSNALAIISQVSSFLSMLNIQGYSRKLLAEESPIGSDGFPSWVSEDERRILKSKGGKKIKLKANVTVSKDGHGDFTTITEALNNMPKKYKGRYVIYIKKGIYRETVNVTRKMENVTMYGEGSKKTIITGWKNYVDGTRTFQTASAVISGRNFLATNMAFRNTAGAIKHQAVALRVNADRAIFFRCRMEGHQDTLYAQSLRQFYRSCIISGTIDFIFGDAAAVFQNCRMIVRRPLDNQQNIVTAQGRVDRQETTGFVLHRCQIVPDARFKLVMNQFKTFLARPWKEYSRTVIMESYIGELIHPDGYMPWEGDFALNTLYYAEYNNTGPGANVTSRVKWLGVRSIKKSEAKRFTVDRFIQGAEWLGGTGVPVRMDLYQ